MSQQHTSTPLIGSQVHRRRALTCSRRPPPPRRQALTCFPAADRPLLDMLCRWTAAYRYGTAWYGCAHAWYGHMQRTCCRGLVPASGMSGGGVRGVGRKAPPLAAELALLLLLTP